MLVLQPCATRVAVRRASLGMQRWMAKRDSAVSYSIMEHWRDWICDLLCDQQLSTRTCATGSGRARSSGGNGPVRRESLVLRCFTVEAGREETGRSVTPSLLMHAELATAPYECDTVGGNSSNPEALSRVETVVWIDVFNRTRSESVQKLRRLAEKATHAFRAAPVSYGVRWIDISTLGESPAVDHRSKVWPIETATRSMTVTEFLTVVDRRDCGLDQLGLILAERRSLLANVQAELVSTLVQWWFSGQTHSRLCGASLRYKDSRSTVLRTVYGKVIVKSPRRWSYAYEQTAQTPQRVVHPLSKTRTSRATPELEYLQAKWAAHVPYRQATTMRKEVMPLNKGISFSGARNRIHIFGKLLDVDIGCDIPKLLQAVTDVQVRKSSHVAAASVDSAWMQKLRPVGQPWPPREHRGRASDVHRRSPNVVCLCA